MAEVRSIVNIQDSNSYRGDLTLVQNALSSSINASSGNQFRTDINITSYSGSSEISEFKTRISLTNTNLKLEIYPDKEVQKLLLGFSKVFNIGFSAAQMWEALMANTGEQINSSHLLDIYNKIYTETAVRSNADITLQSNIDAEATVRNSADSIISAKIDDTEESILNEAIRATNNESRIEGKLDEMFTDVNHTLIKTTHSFESLNDIEAKGYVIGHNGVAALGIVDTEDGEERYRVKVYDAITENEAEVVTDIPTAYSVGKLKKDIDTEGFSTFSTSVSYNRGDIVNYNGHAYRFKSSKGAGDWNSARVEMLNYDSLTKPLGMSESTINTIFDNVISGL